MITTWMTLEEAARETGISVSTLRKWCAARAIDSRCGRRFGRVWRFKRQVIETEGLIVDEGKVHTFHKKYSPRCAVGTK